MSGWLVGLLVGLGFGAVAVRRPAAAAVLVSAQTMLVGVGALALAPGRSAEFAVAGTLLLLKALIVSAIVAVGVVRSRETRPHPDGPGLLVRLAATLVLVLTVVALVPPFGLESRGAENAPVALLATGLALALIRGATLFAVLAFLIAENGTSTRWPSDRSMPA